MAPNVDTMLKGARPGDLPITAVHKHELLVNFRTVQALGVTMADNFVKHANHVMA